MRRTTEPEARLREISAALGLPKPDPSDLNDLNDLTWYLNGKLDSIPIREDVSDFQFKVERPQNDCSPLSPAQRQPGFEKAYGDVAKLRAISPLIDWLVTGRGPKECD